MFAKKYFIRTTKEVPTEADLPSHRLMIRTGMIKMLAKGIYVYMPLALKVIQKMKTIIREEMRIAGAIEMLMPIVQPAGLWEKSGRLKEYGLELLRIKDRKHRNFVLQATSEEVITAIACDEIHSYRQLPLNFYHIQTKFRDELRPRFGLLRSREFIMKDGYSFDYNKEKAQESYNSMLRTYKQIFKRFGLLFKVVPANTGSIGGDFSHEFHIIAKNGENIIACNSNSDLSMSIELAKAPCLIKEREKPKQKFSKIHIAKKLEEPRNLADSLKISLEKIVKCAVFITEEKIEDAFVHLCIIRGDHEFNNAKIHKLPGMCNARLAEKFEIFEYFSCSSEYIGPIGNKNPINIIVDNTVANMTDFVCGANQDKTYYCGVNWFRDIKEPNLIADLRNVINGDRDLNSGNILELKRSIEVAHIFFLGDKYSKLMKATFLDHYGRSIPFQMACYGIGISRVMAATIEQNYDEKGIIWPKALAPFEVVICPIGWNENSYIREISFEIYNSLLKKGIDIILDDRNIRPGVMFSEWDLIGIPIRVTIGEKDIKDKTVELKDRFDRKTEIVSIKIAIDKILEKFEKNN